jgi:sulfite dehydrogenase
MQNNNNTPKPENLQRRRWLTGTGLALGASSLAGFSQSALAQAVSTTVTPAKPLPPIAAWKTADAMIIHSASTVELKRSAFGSSVITATEKLFVRNNLKAPDAAILNDRDAWTLQVEGVKKPISFTLKQLRQLGVETVTTVLQCSGNGRGFFPSKPSGTPWQVGAAGCVVWSGVPVRAVIEACGGMQEAMKYMTGTGGEQLPEGIDPKSLIVERSLPLHAIDDAILAWEMNGSPLTLAHGAPLRLIVPGYSGINNIKYIKRLAFTSNQTEANIQKRGYRLTPVGQESSADQPSVWEMPVKSWITSPTPDLGDVAAGTVIIQGVAFAGFNPVNQVEVSVDGGKTWHKAKFFGPDMGKYAWRQFTISLPLKPGTYQIASRARDTAGNVQPEVRFENASGYNNNSWLDHSLSIKVTA